MNWASEQREKRRRGDDESSDMPVDGSPKPKRMHGAFKGLCRHDSKWLRREIHCDSHTTSAGAFGQFATGVGNTDAAFIWDLLHFIKKTESAYHHRIGLYTLDFDIFSFMYTFTHAALN
ncbi:hypothetical protein TSUD_54560 [Trifolium subterraneum]|uniref:Uncharacterized protein n=1 Tax=Trifolium subterraneum TaxID=3900 RepID=A0A2Z6NYS9_TRISU|nr:hypothetical protein TSUD_54560 [Trifolium subterraneum]